MLKNILLFFLLLFPLASRALDIGVSYAVYATPEKNYLEVNLEIAALSVTYVKAADSTNLQAAVEILILIKKDGEIANFEKYVLNSPLVKVPVNLLDVKRLPLPNGSYTLEITAQDVYTKANKKSMSYPVTVDIRDSIYLADVQLLRSYHPDESAGIFNKNGYFMEPLPFNFYERSAVNLIFYTEIYHSDHMFTPGNSYIVRYFIQEDQPNGGKNLVSVGTQRKKAGPVDAVLVQMDISKLESGNYILNVELRTRSNELITTRTVRFQRSNPFLTISPEAGIPDDVMKKQFTEQMDTATLRYSLRAITAVVPSTEGEALNNVLKSNDLKQMRYFLFRYFAKQNPNMPEVAFKEYMQLANYAAEKFKSGFRYGFETDRGRIFMKYGRPNDMVHVEDDPSAPPYEIWIYTDFPKTRQQNVRFLFYNPSLAGEDFILLHSTARGELNNPRWERDLYARHAGEQYDGPNYQDATQMQRNVGRNARVYFEDF